MQFFLSFIIYKSSSTIQVKLIAVNLRISVQARTVIIERMEEKRGKKMGLENNFIYSYISFKEIFFFT